jgi:hypothetical protein
MGVELDTFYLTLYTDTQLRQYKDYEEKILELEGMIPITQLREHARLNGWDKLTLKAMREERETRLETEMEQGRQPEEDVTEEIKEGKEGKKRKKKEKNDKVKEKKKEKKKEKEKKDKMNKTREGEDEATSSSFDA